MYKKFSLAELTTYQTNFFKHLKSLMTNEKADTLSAWLKTMFRYGYEVYYFEGNEPLFRIIKSNDSEYVMYDEQERIHLICSSEDIRTIHNILKNDSKRTWGMTKNILDTLIDEFLDGNYRLIWDKPYLVYDIETPIATNDLSKLPFALWYVTLSNQDKSSFQAQYISKDNLQKFVDFIIWFDGYVIWYNNIWFDNPVIAYNVWYTDEQIQLINDKSLDLFQVMQNLTGKRIWLNKLSTALIWLKKTLEWAGNEGSTLLKLYTQTWDEKALAKVKEYCKNDVKMTLGVLLYLMKFGKIQTEDGEYSFQVNDLVWLGKIHNNITKSDVISTNNTMFE